MPGKIISAILVAMAVATNAAPVPVDWTNCGAPTDVMQISKFELSGPITPGQPVTFELAGKMTEEVPGGTYDVEVQIGGVNILSKKGDFCEITKQAGMPCPLAAAPFDVKPTVNVPGGIPQIKVDVVLKATSTAGKALVCAKASAQIGGAAAVTEMEPAALNEAVDQFLAAGFLLPRTEKSFSATAVRKQYHFAHKNDAQIIADVNSNPKSTWTAGHNEFFAGWNLEKRQRFMSLRTNVNTFPTMTYANDDKAVPESFDSREQWGSCIGPVLNQAECGSCWAFGAVEAASDRMCIEARKNDPKAPFVQLAALDVMTNSDGFFQNNGCQGGQLGLAWDYFQSHGSVTEACLPYGDWEKPIPGPIPTCAPDKQPCMPPTFVQTPPPQTECAQGSNLTFESDKSFVKNVYNIGGERDMQREIMENGPIEGQFSVYSDFPTYKSGVYQQSPNANMLGGHAIKIIGWGVENDTPYWLVQNSWTTTWGDGGYFKIVRGQDECGIESGAVAGTM